MNGVLTEQQFHPVCLHCGTPNHSDNYTCSCQTEVWRNRYRVLDLKIDLEQYGTEFDPSFPGYSFYSRRGILQYPLLPYHRLSGNLPAVGLTPLPRLSYFSRQTGCDVFMKYEGANPSGCFKDRETLPCLLHSKASGRDKAVIFSSGNAAASAALMANFEPSFELLAFVSGDTYPEKIEFIRRQGSDVVIIGDEQTSYETGYRLFSELNRKHIFTDWGYDNWSVRNPYRVQGDKTTAVEMVKQLSGSSGRLVVPDYVLVPTANGSCLAGIWKGFKELYALNVISTLPKMVSVGISRANPVYKAVQRRRLTSPVRCRPEEIDPHDASAGSTMLAEEGYDVMEAAKAVIQSKGVALEVHTTDVQQAYFDYLRYHPREALEEEMLPEPAAMLSLAALPSLKEKMPVTSGDKIIAVATGSASKAVDAVTELLTPREDLQQQVIRHISSSSQSLTTEHRGTRGRTFSVEATEDALSDIFYRMISVYA